MPITVPIIIAIAGVAALLLGISGGGIKAKEVAIPSIQPTIRVFSLIVGIGLIGASVWLSVPSSSVSQTLTNTILPASEIPTPIIVNETITQTATLNLPTADTFVDDFTNGSQYWETGVKDDDRRTASRTIVNGVLQWQVMAKQTAITGITSKLPKMSDFDLEVTLELVDGSESLEYGVQFRNSDAGCYYFLIGRNGKYVLDKWSEQDQKHLRLIDWLSSTAINLSGKNTFRVHAVGNKLRVYINNVLLGDIVDNSFSSGTINVLAWLDPEETLTVDMSSFKVTLLSP